MKEPPHLSTKRVLIFANGQPESGPLLDRVLTEAAEACVIAADGGARLARHYGLTVQRVIGDMDSLTPDELDALAQAGADIQRHPEEKDETDLELALLWATEAGAEWIRIIGGIGGRFDQTLGNVYLLALPALVGCDVRLVTPTQEIYVLRPGVNHLHGQPDDTISLIPLSTSVTGIHTDNLYYPLDNERLVLGPARGISNVLVASPAQVSFSDGLLLVVHTMGRAE